MAGNNETAEGEPEKKSPKVAGEEKLIGSVTRWFHERSQLRQSGKEQQQQGGAKRVGYSVEPVGSVGELSAPAPPREALYLALQGMSQYYEAAMLGLSQVDAPTDTDEAPS
ncbi:hypothetical protein OG241_18085 [Streptomyces sp. NBC_01390]|uniref:hypothetical protein n=1 Tax=Streptomyces sp. NBC_01390 TaxID=2903850 RepID=UPI0032448198